MELALITLAIVYFLLFYFMKMRPEKKRKKEKLEMKRSLAPGDDVTMIDGIVGTICAVKKGTIVLETGADRVRLEYAKWGILEKGINVESDTAEPES